MRERARRTATAGLLVCLAVPLALAACDSGDTVNPEQAQPQETVESLSPAKVAEGPDLLLKGAKVMTAAGTILETGDVLVIDGRIKEVAESIAAPEGVEVIDVAGKVVTPGIIDTHTHIDRKSVV